MDEVKFYSSVSGISRLVATIIYENNKISVHGRENYKTLLLRGAKDPEAIKQAMREAPKRFDGAYLKAEYIE